MTGNHKNTSDPRRRAIAVTGGTVAAGGLAVAGYQPAFAGTTADAEAIATASATSTGSACRTLMTRTSVTEGPYYLDGGGASSGLPTLRAVRKKDPSKGYKGFLALGIDPDAENTGAGSGGGGTPPSGTPTGMPPSDGAGPSASASSS